MKLPFRNNDSLQNTNWLLAGLGVLFLVVWLLPDLPVLRGVVLMSLPTHMYAETFSVIVTMLVFFLVFSTPSKVRSGNHMILASAFLAVGLLDVAHTLSYPGMPDFVSPGNVEKAIYFWLVARYVAAITLLVVAVLQWKNVIIRIDRYWLLFASLGFTAIAYWVGLYHQQWFPHTFIEGQGLTSFKVWAEYGIITVLLIPAVLFYRQASKRRSLDASGLYAATVITILSELCFTLYADVTGLMILLGHIYKVAAYFFLFRAIFLSLVRDPYQRLYESEQYNRTLFETSSIGLAVAQMDGLLVDINQSFANIIGRTVDETKQLTYWQITPEEYAEQERYQLEQLQAKQSYGPYEKEFLHRDGHRVPVRLSGRLIERNGEAFVWSSVEDISEVVEASRARYESEQNFRQLAEHVREVFWLSDIEKSIIFYVSPAYETVWGRSCASLYANPASYIEAIHPEDRERVGRAILRQAEGPYDEEYRVVHPDGTIRWVRDQAFPVRDSYGVIYRIAGVAEDVTEEKRAKELLEKRVVERTQSLSLKEEELITAKEEAERANLAKTQFLSRMSHELRTPLNAILGFSQLLNMDTALAAEHKNMVNDIWHGGKHLLMLVNEVLDLAKVESGKYELNPKRISLRDTMTECVALTSSLVTHHGVSLSVNFDSFDRIEVYLDPTRLKQVILNLVSNACKYNQSGGSVSVECSRLANDRVQVSVVDTGKGIPRDRQADIFEPFNRLDAEYSGVEGTGIGLTITRQLVEAMGGSIGLESEVGRGSKFWIELPAL